MSSNESYSDYQSSITCYDHEVNNANLPQNLNFTLDEIRQQLNLFGYTDIPNDKLLVIKKDLDEIISKDESIKGSINVQNQNLVDNWKIPENDSEIDNRSFETLSSYTPTTFSKMKRKTNCKISSGKTEVSAPMQKQPKIVDSVQDEENYFRKVFFPQNPVEDIFNYTGVSVNPNDYNAYPIESKKLTNAKTNSFIKTNVHKFDNVWQRHDPVSRYHSYKMGWDSKKAPGESAHKQLRWAIKAALMVREVPRPRITRIQSARSQNSYLPPGQNKRNDIRWQVRQELANPDVYFD